MMTAAAAMMTTATAVVEAIAGGAMATVATVTGDGRTVGAHQGQSDGGEKHRRSTKNDSVHFCIPPLTHLLEQPHN
jgi:hypothetical protein